MNDDSYLPHGWPFLFFILYIYQIWGISPDESRRPGSHKHGLCSVTLEDMQFPLRLFRTTLHRHVLLVFRSQKVDVMLRCGVNAGDALNNKSACVCVEHRELQRRRCQNQTSPPFNNQMNGFDWHVLTASLNRSLLSLKLKTVWSCHSLVNKVTCRWWQLFGISAEITNHYKNEYFHFFFYPPSTTKQRRIKLDSLYS